MDITIIEDFIRQLTAVLDITQGINLKVMLAVLILMVIGEVDLQIPLLIESIWLVIGYQSGANATALFNIIALFLIAQLGRQIGISSVYYLFQVINSPLSRFYMKRLQRNRYYQKFAQRESSYSARYLSLSTATLGMLTWLNMPIKAMLVIKRKLRTLLIGTLLSGAAFDVVYIVAGAVFHVTTLNLAYLPAFLLVGFVVFIVIRMVILRRDVQ
ncbi:MAG: hypothetical protein Q8O05_01795 [Chloroflexota bacterium]|nr:hypothetical protein [Chloroflexota bacterium]